MQFRKQKKQKRFKKNVKCGDQTKKTMWIQLKNWKKIRETIKEDSFEKVLAK